MISFRINLIRDLVPPRRVRIRLFFGLTAYVVLVGAALALLSAFVIGRIRDRLEDRRRMDILERQFRELYPDVTNLKDYAEDLNLALGKCNDQLALVRQVLSRQISVTPVLLAVFSPLSNGMRILSLHLDREKKAFSFEVAVPVQVYEHQLRTDLLMSAWSQNSDLSRHVKSIVLVGSRRDRVGDSMCFILSFSCALKEAAD